MTRTSSTNGKDLIKRFEGCVLTAYKCPKGIWTIGWGNTRYKNGSAIKEGDKLTQQEADDLFDYYVDKSFAPAVDSLVGSNVIITQENFDALVSFAYNLGSGALGGSTLLKKVKDDPKDKAIRDEFMKWVYSGTTKLQGLVNRRKAEADMYFS